MQRRRQTQREIKVVIQFDYLTKAQPSCVEFEVAQQAEIISSLYQDMNINKKDEALARKLNFYGMKT